MTTAVTHVPTAENRKLVRSHAAVGTPQPTIAKFLKITDRTLRKYYKDDLALGVAEANATVAGNLFKIASKAGGGPGTVSAAIFWLKVRAQWKTPEALELTGANGGPVKTENADTGATAEIRAILERLAAVKAGGHTRPAEVAGDSAPESAEPTG